MTQTQPEDRLYGQFQKPQSPGLFGQGLVATLAGVGGVALSVLVLVFTQQYLVSAVIVGLTIMVLVPLVLRRDNQPLIKHWMAAGGWRYAAWRRRNTYRSGPLGVVPGGQHRLPGLLAATDCYEFHGAGRRFALLHHTRAFAWTVVIQCYPQGADLVDDAVLDRRVADHGRFLASFANDPYMLGIQQVVEVVRDPGGKLRHAITRLISPDAPEGARRVMEHHAHNLPAEHVAVTERTAITWRPPKSVLDKPRAERPEAMALWVANKLGPICAGLLQAGGGAARPMTEVEISEELRLAYDPAAADEIDQQRIDQVRTSTWADCGPSTMVDQPGSLVHDSGVSVSWSMAEAPRGEIDRNALIPLLVLEPGVVRKRVALTFRPEPSHKGAARVRRSVKATSFRSSQDYVGDAGDSLDMDAHRASQRELRRGAALVPFTIHVTATVTDPDATEGLVESIEAAGQAAQIRMRRCWWHQQVGFSAALGVGVIPSHLARLPQIVRESL